MEQYKRFTPLVLTLLAAVILQMIFVVADRHDTPIRAAIEFSKAYFMLNPSMAGRLCEDLDLQFKSENDHAKLILDGQDITLAIRSPEMDMLSSTVSAVKEVREAMKSLQRKLGSQGKIVAEGRDMGTVVFPDADHKFFITASIEERALRRYRERQARGEAVTKEAVEMDLRRRDEQDTKRAIAPLRPAENARVIDTTHLNPQEVIEKMLSLLWPIESWS